MRLKTLALVPVCLACASSPTQWTQPGATQAQFNADRLECQVEAQQWSQTGNAMAAGGYPGYAVVGFWAARRVYRQCMELRGYVVAKGDD